MTRNTKGVCILLGAALIWGLSFPAQAVVVDHHVSAFTFNALRCLMGALFLLLVQKIRIRTGALQASLEKRGVKQAKGATILLQPRRMVLRAGLFCGMAVFFGVNLQQFGMQLYPAGVASSGRAGFLTATYVVIVALVSFLVGKRPHVITYAAAGVCLLGMYFLCLSGGFSGIYLGDVLMLLDAVGFTVQIMLVDHYTELDGLTLCCMQFFVCGGLSLICMLLFEHVNWADVAAVFWPLAYCGIGSSACGYTLQIIGQKYADPAPASIAMSMESVFSGIGGWLLIGQVMSGRELIGCALVFAAVIMTQIPPFLSRRVPVQQGGE